MTSLAPESTSSVSGALVSLDVIASCCPSIIPYLYRVNNKAYQVGADGDSVCMLKPKMEWLTLPGVLETFFKDCLLKKAKTDTLAKMKKVIRADTACQKVRPEHPPRGTPPSHTHGTPPSPTPWDPHRRSWPMATRRAAGRRVRSR